MKMTLSEIHAEYEAIMQEKEPHRTHRLADLMTYMEQAYEIPTLRNEAWEKENKAVIAMYRKISMSRNFD